MNNENIMGNVADAGSKTGIFSSRMRYTLERKTHWDTIARNHASAGFFSEFYRKLLVGYYSFLIPPGKSILEIGCGRGELLAALKPSRGTGVDLSSAMIADARLRHPAHTFIEADGHDLADIEGPFDFIVLSDLVNDVWDVQELLGQLQRLCHNRSRVVLNFYNRLWEFPLETVRFLKVAHPVLPQNWLASSDVENLLAFNGFETVKKWREVLLPIPIWGLHWLCNRILARLWPFKYLALTTFVVARRGYLSPAGQPSQQPSVSVIVPARNEEGNIPDIAGRIPEMGRSTQIIFVEGGSSDNTWNAIESAVAANQGRDISALKQIGKGKGDAVRCGFEAAGGDILMILDADISVQPEDLTKFYQALASGQADFANGVRFVYPMEKQAMKYLNTIGNKFFSSAFSWLLGQPIKDTLCGTKVVWRADYEKITANRRYFGEFDPFGDFDLLFGAAKLSLKIVDIPVRYHERRWGTTNIQRWKHGVMLLGMVAFAARKIKFF